MNYKRRQQPAEGDPPVTPVTVMKKVGAGASFGFHKIPYYYTSLLIQRPSHFLPTLKTTAVTKDRSKSHRNSAWAKRRCSLPGVTRRRGRHHVSEWVQSPGWPCLCPGSLQNQGASPGRRDPSAGGRGGSGGAGAVEHTSRQEVTAGWAAGRPHPRGDAHLVLPRARGDALEPTLAWVDSRGWSALCLLGEHYGPRTQSALWCPRLQGCSG